MNLPIAQRDPVLLLLWRSLGPYHLARAQAAAEVLRERSVRTVVAELCDAEDTRDWQVDRACNGLEIRTIAPGARLTDRTRNLSRETRALLHNVAPRYLAIAGYDRPEMRAALRWANRRGAGAILMSETKWDDRPRPWWRRRLAAREVRRADAALVSGSAAGEYLVALGMPRERIFRQYGAVDNGFFHERTVARRDAGGRRYFLACSRLIESRKNIKRLLLAYATYRQRAAHDPWDLVICGDGSDRADLEQFRDREAVPGVTFAGFQQVETLADRYAGASCFVHTAVNEAWGLVVNEALASGLPVLVSRRCGCAFDLVHEGHNGFTFDPHDVDELAELMHRVARLPQERRDAMGAASLRTVARFGCAQFAAGLLQAMESADRRHRRAPVSTRNAGSADGRQQRMFVETKEPNASFFPRG
jgi:glycosyltransferase involved in cell wall biosynthesis